MSAPLLGGKYELQAPVGKGPHGKVYRALHVQTQRPVIVKVIAQEALEPRVLEPFRHYAAGLARVRHPALASFIELVEVEGRFCLVSELAEGVPLASLLEQGVALDPKKAWEVSRHMLEGLAYAHSQSAIHRNLKPSNVLVTAEGAAILLDLGTSMLHRSRRDNPEYLSPEHFRRHKLTERSDIYQAAVIVYQMVTGRLPFNGSAEEVARGHAEERAEDPSSHNRHLAWQLDWVIQKALSKLPEERYGSALDFGEGLRLGLQDTVGRPLPPLLAPAPLPRASASPLVENARLLAPKAPPAAPPPPPPPPRAEAAPKVEPAPKVEAPPKVDAPRIVEAPTKVEAPAKTEAPPKAAAPRSLQPPPAPAKPSPGVAQEAARGAGKPGVLFVDDDPRILTSLRSLFRQDYEVQLAESAQAALEAIARGGIHVIVTDQRMPGMTGVELLRNVRSTAPAIARVLLTGYTDLASLVGSINQGEIFRFVMKPWDNDEMRKAVAEAASLAAKLAAVAPAKPTAPRSAGSLLVIDRSEGMARGLERLLAGAAQVIRVQSPAEAAKVLSREEIAAVVADMGTGMDGLVALFRELRAKRPGVLSILLTDEPDSDLAIELINRAQIFRLLPKPVSARDLRSQVAEALRRYSVYKQRAAASSAAGQRPEAPGERAAAGTR